MEKYNSEVRNGELLKENEVLANLINATYYLEGQFMYTATEEVKRELVERGYFEGIDNMRFTKKTIELLNNFYKEHSKDFMRVLRRLKVPTKFVLIEDICKESAMDKNNVIFLMKKLEEDGEIRISASTNWDEKVKYLID
ncbi:hypothetical protein CN384_25860 [Bacillus thuringiensis]|uniref:hypothetical protein n=1 Tax=Bacillus thuringiensis TaxID=1428 RepID=UPI000BF7EEAD|nr:hypothetical protein [Bacillus thuringiensis]PFA22354.1 hypothetical protein CN384_25860 [Bacillus thuringiensis]PGN16882.1 hypothetical protein CN951_25190 [Bacillus thuringiensis]